jgi:hypothetical protein
VAAGIYAGGLAMLDALSIPPADGGGIVRVRDESEGARLLADADAFRIAGVARLKPQEAEERLGQLHESGVFYTIPDTPFPEHTVLERLREAAIRNGVQFITTSQPAHLQSSSESPSGACVRCQELIINSKVTLLTAGAGIIPLLADLGVAPCMKLRQTPLLVIPSPEAITAALFADRVRRFSFVRHLCGSSPNEGPVLVVGTGVHSNQVEYCAPERRAVSAPDARRFFELLPPILRRQVNAGRFTAGFEVMPADGSRRRHVEPWVNWVPGFPGVLFGLPGRATLGMSVAHQIVEQLVPRLGRPSEGPRQELTLPAWSQPIKMHFDSGYGFNDYKERKGHHEPHD